VSDATAGEDVESFRLRARAWLAENMPPQPDEPFAHTDPARWPRAKELQRLLFDAGFAGLCFPKAYGGQGLSLAYQQAFDAEVKHYEMPLTLNVPTFGIIAATLLEFGNEEQKERYLPPILSGEEVWVQLLSEPTGGSDLASVMTRATPDADDFVLSGSKVWSSGAYAADYGICVARTNWDVPKHDGISVLIVKMDQPGVTVERIRGVAGDDEFCQEFFDDVRIPAANVLGEVDAGWTVVRGLLAHERNSMGGASPFVSGGGLTAPSRQDEILALARRLGRTGDPRVRQLVAEAHVLGLVQDQTSHRVTGAMMRGELGPPFAAQTSRWRSPAPIPACGRRTIRTAAWLATSSWRDREASSAAEAPRSNAISSASVYSRCRGSPPRTAAYPSVRSAATRCRPSRAADRSSGAALDAREGASRAPPSSGP